MNVAGLLKHFDIDAIIGIDFETFYGKKYSLRSMATTEYIVDPRFKAHCVSLQPEDHRKATVIDLSRSHLRPEWSRVGVLCHHAHFDGLILSHHYGIHPKVFFDTLSMARPLVPVTIRKNLHDLCKAFGLKGKVGAQALVDMLDVRDPTREQLGALMKYAGNDIEQTWALFRKLLPFLPVSELELIDLTVKMYTRPSVLINARKVRGVNRSEIKKKAGLIAGLRVTREQLTSNSQFAELMLKNGVTLPTKVSKRTGQVALATSKQDLAFKALLKHPRKRVRRLIEARLALKSSILETRSKKMEQRSVLGPQPIYLNYCGAKTLRWSGSDKMNWQNFNRGSDLRLAIIAPDGHMLLITDQSQVEARLNAWRSGQVNVVQAYRLFDQGKGPDVYRLTAAEQIYNKPIAKITDGERFVGKTGVLGLGYGAGAPRFADMLRIGQFGPPVDITDVLAKDIVTAWRQANSFIVQSWYNTGNNAKSAFLGQQRINDGLLTFEGKHGHGFIHLPGGMALRYDEVRTDSEGEMIYTGMKNKQFVPIRLWGGILVENIISALARMSLAEQMISISRTMPKVKIATMTHDELLIVTPKRGDRGALREVVRIMSTTPAWATGLPLSVKAKLSERYEKD
jgi:DNA polymerase